MNRAVKVSLVAGVLFGGIALALFFKKSPSDESTTDSEVAAEVTPDDVDLPDLTPEEQAAGQSNAGASPAADDVWDKDAAVPKVSSSFEPSSRPPADSRWNQPENSDPFSDRLAVLRNDSTAGSPRTELKYHIDDSPTPTAAQPVRVHKIADGDTLSALSQKYYGDATAAGGIFEANRDVLADPDLLPIGREIQIPPRRSVTVQKPTQPAPHHSDLVPVGTK